MDCYCASKNLYRKDKLKAFNYLDKLTGKKTEYAYERNNRDTVYNAHNSKFASIFSSTLENGTAMYPMCSIDEVQYETIVDDPLNFYKEYISANKPCKILGAIDNWGAMKKWRNLEYLKEKMGGREITVDITPDGFADSIYNKFFAQPKQIKTTFEAFLELKKHRNLGEAVPYIQKQNNNLNTEFPFLLEDVKNVKEVGNKVDSDEKKDLPDIKEFFQEHFFGGEEADSVNFWMGFSDSVSSMHKDPYENIYAVIQGEKHFTLAPSAILPYTGVDSFVNCKWNSSPDYADWWLEDINDAPNQQGDLQDNEGNQPSEVMWCSNNPDLAEDYHRFFGEDVPIFHVTVFAGEVLYLPSLWFHQVTQFAASSTGELEDTAYEEDFVIAANFWFDMKFGQSFQLMETLKGLVDLEKHENSKKATDVATEISTNASKQQD